MATFNPTQELCVYAKTRGNSVEVTVTVDTSFTTLEYVYVKQSLADAFAEGEQVTLRMTNAEANNLDACVKWVKDRADRSVPGLRVEGRWWAGDEKPTQSAEIDAHAQSDGTLTLAQDGTDLIIKAEDWNRIAKAGKAVAELMASFRG